MTATTPKPDAPTVNDDGSPMPRYRLAFTLLVDSHGTRPADAAHRAYAALRAPTGPFEDSSDPVHGPAQRWECHAEVVSTQLLNWRELDDSDSEPYAVVTGPVNDGDEDDPLPDAPLVLGDGTPMPRYRLALAVLIDSHGVDPGDASNRATAALRINGGASRHTICRISGPGNRWTCHAEVLSASMLSWRQLDA